MSAIGFAPVPWDLDEMMMALWRLLPSEVQEGREPDDIRPWVAAVLAIVEREQRAAAEREWDALRECPSASPTDGVAPVLHCEREAGHGGAHGAYRYLTSWRDLDQATTATGSNPSGGAK